MSRLFALALAGLAGCAPVVTPSPPPVGGGPEPLPTLRVEQVVGGGEAAGDGILGRPVEPLPHRAADRITLTATDAEVAGLMAALAEAAGVDLIAGPEVGGRVTVRFENVPALEALHHLIRETGHMVVEPLRAPWEAPVFYVRPVNVNEADGETIRARFGVSLELARYLVRMRNPIN